MSKRNKGTHGIYDLTCISDKCSRRFKVIWDCQLEKVAACRNPLSSIPGPRGWFPERMVKRLTYPFNGCPFCGAWWPTGPLDGEAYPKKKQVSYAVPVNPLLQTILQGQANMARGAIGPLGGGMAQGLGGATMRWWG